jgi:DNA-binding NarL/FixJ family response regulator
MTIRILVADDHPIVRAGTIALIANESDMTVVAEAADGREAVALYDSHVPDVALIDLRMPVMDGITAMVSIFSAHPEARLVALTTSICCSKSARAVASAQHGVAIVILPIRNR